MKRSPASTIGPIVTTCMLAILLSACAAVPTDSGVRGMVTIGPTSPVQRPGEPSEAPYAAELVVKGTDSREVARTRSGADGTYSVNLVPGSYTIEGVGGDTPPSPPAPVAFEVAAHRFTTVNLSFDSGIR